MNISRNQTCPCGSGKKYKKCCLNKNGDDLVSIPITPQIKEILDRENDRFKSIMGRDIQGDEPLLPSTVLMSENEYKRHVTTMLREIKVNEAVIYAFNKLGICIVNEQIDKYSPEQLEEWEDAIEEYDLLASGAIKHEANPFDEIIQKLYKCLERLQFLYALIIRKYSNSRNKILLTNPLEINDYILFCLTRNLKSIKSINCLLENHFSEDALNLTRTNFENYLEIIYAKYSPLQLKKQKLFESGVAKGTHKKKYKSIVDTATNESIEVPNNFDKIKLNSKFKEIDIDIYKYLYDYLSSYTHPDLRTAHNYVDPNLGFTDLSENSKTESLVFLLAINFMLLFEIRDLRVFKKSQSDIDNLILEIGAQLTLLIQNGANIGEPIKERINNVLSLINPALSKKFSTVPNL